MMEKSGGLAAGCIEKFIVSFLKNKMKINRQNMFIGQIIELKVQEEMLRYGFDVSVPTYNSARYDLIVDTGKEVLKIQVKKATQGSDVSFTFPCYSQNNYKSTNTTKRKYTNEEIDYFATVWKDKVYFVPVDETSKQKTIRFTDTQYLSTNIFSSYYRLSDEEIYNRSAQYSKTKEGNNKCDKCGKSISPGRNLCVDCYHASTRKIERPTREELKNLIRTEPFTKIGKMYNVTDNAIRKWCDSYSLPRKKGDIQKYNEEEWKLL